MIKFNSKDDLIYYVLINYVYGFMHDFSSLARLTDKKLAKEVIKLSHGEAEMVIEDGKYYLKKH